MDTRIRHPLAYARAERGWSQEDLARYIRQAAARRGLRSGCNWSRVHKWESGRVVPDAAESQPLIADVLGIDYRAVAGLGWPYWLPGRDQPLPLGDNAVPALREALMNLLDRRAFLAYTSAALTDFARQWATAGLGPPPPTTTRATVDPELITWLEDAARTLTRLAPGSGTPTGQLLTAHLTMVTDLIGQGRYTTHDGRRLHALAAILSQTIAWQRFDEHRHASAGRLWHAALHNAHHAGEHDLGAGILSDLAYQLLWLDDPRTAVDLLDHAIPSAHHPAARALLHMRQARAYAKLSDAGRCVNALTAAEKALARPAPDPAPAWCAWMSHADLAADSGRCLSDLGDHRRARDLMNQGIDMFPATRVKTQSIFLTYTAETYLGTADTRTDRTRVDVGGAVRAATAALDLADRIHARRCMVMVRDLAPRFAEFRCEPGVPALLARLYRAAPD